MKPTVEDTGTGRPGHMIQYSGPIPHCHTCRTEVRIDNDDVVVTEWCVLCGKRIHEVRIKGSSEPYKEDDE